MQAVLYKDHKVIAVVSVFSVAQYLPASHKALVNCIFIDK